MVLMVCRTVQCLDVSLGIFALGVLGTFPPLDHLVSPIKLWSYRVLDIGNLILEFIFIYIYNIYHFISATCLL